MHSRSLVLSCCLLGIRHVHTPPYHPASNGLVERAVQTFKESMKRLRSGSVDTRLARFLLKYRVTPHSTTGVSPAELMMGRKLRTQLDLLHPDTSRAVQKSQDRQRLGGRNPSSSRSETRFTHETTRKGPRGSRARWWNEKVKQCWEFV